MAPKGRSSLTEGWRVKVGASHSLPSRPPHVGGCLLGCLWAVGAAILIFLRVPCFSKRPFLCYHMVELC